MTPLIVAIPKWINLSVLRKYASLESHCSGLQQFSLYSKLILCAMLKRTHLLSWYLYNSGYLVIYIFIKFFTKLRRVVLRRGIHHDFLFFPPDALNLAPLLLLRVLGLPCFFLEPPLFKLPWLCLLLAR